MFGHGGQEIIADLVSQAAGPAVQHDGQLTFKETEGLGGRDIINRVHHTHFHKMVARPQGAQLTAAPFHGPGD